MPPEVTGDPEARTDAVLRGPEVRSFRDPGGIVTIRGDHVFRFLRPCALPDLAALESSSKVREFLKSGALVPATALSADQAGRLAREELGEADGGKFVSVLQHERIPFASYPYEWPPEMLHRAASLTLTLASELLHDGIGLKDATPYNILFRGTEPVFVDWLSLERRSLGDPIWRAWAQFAAMFLVPLALNRHLGVPLDGLLTCRSGGVAPEEAYPMLGPLKGLRPPFLTLVSIPRWLGSGKLAREAPARLAPAVSAEKARFILSTFYRRAARTLARLAPRADRRSAWAAYEEESCSYSGEAFAAKEAFVRRALDEFAPKWVLDVGSNTGRFSLMAAAAGARVVALDRDSVVVGRLYAEAVARGADVLPLVVDLARPTPATGWRNRECPSFLDRARGSFDLVLLLAVVHHLLVTDRVPLEEVVGLCAELSRRAVVVEYVPPSDPMFGLIARGREALHAGLTEAAFEAAWARRFVLLRRESLPGSGRILCLFSRREAAQA